MHSCVVLLSEAGEGQVTLYSAAALSTYCNQGFNGVLLLLVTAVPLQRVFIPPAWIIRKLFKFLLCSEFQEFHGSSGNLLVKQKAGLGRPCFTFMVRPKVRSGGDQRAKQHC